MTTAPPPSAPSALVDRYLQEQQAMQVVEASETNLFVPGAPEPGLTLPTTTYRTRRVLPRNMIPADYYAVRPADAHWSLILMLALTQLSVGAFLVERMLELFVPGALSAGIRPVHSASALAFGLLALGVSVLHLGGPQHAYRAVIGLRHSWLSREIPAFGLFAAPDRATTPLRRDAAGVQRPVSWDAALRTMVARFKAIEAQHGPESVAFLSTGQTPTEEMALLGALAKFGMGMVHGDGNTRQCMATAVVAYKQAFGFDAPPYTYRDFEQSDVIVLVGANLCIAHPIMWERVLRNPHHPAIVVIDPRVTETAMQASQHLALRPKSDQALFYGLAHLPIERGWIDRGYIEAHTRGFEEYSTTDRFPLILLTGRGRIAVTAFVTRSVQPGHLFIPMHYEATNRLTDAVFDPYSKQPSYKACAVELHSTAAAA